MAQLFGVFNNLRINESIVVNKSVDETFAFVTDFNNIAKISDNLGDIERLTKGSFAKGSQYSRTLLIHGRPNKQTVTVEEYEENAMFVTQTELFEFDVTYTYRFSPLDNSAVRIDLTKEARARGFWIILRSLLHHLITRPEHDGGHLLALKKAVES